MSATQVQSRKRDTQVTTASDSLAYSSSVTAGNTLTCKVRYGANTMAITDTQGNTWTRRAQQLTTGGVPGEIWTAIAGTTGANSVIMTGDILASIGASIDEWSGLTGTPFDKVANTFGTSTAPNSGNTAALTQADEVVIGFIVGPVATYTKGASYTLDQLDGTGAWISEYKIVAATTAVAADGTIGTSVAWAALVITLKIAAVIPPLDLAMTGGMQDLVGGMTNG